MPKRWIVHPAQYLVIDLAVARHAIQPSQQFMAEHDFLPTAIFAWVPLPQPALIQLSILNRNFLEQQHRGILDVHQHRQPVMTLPTVVQSRRTDELGLPILRHEMVDIHLPTLIVTEAVAALVKLAYPQSRHNSWLVYCGG